jgi:hypothetical protein
VTVYQAVDGRERVTIEIELRPESTAPASDSNLLQTVASELQATTGINYDVVVWDGKGRLSAEVTAGHSGKVRRWRDLR